GAAERRNRSAPSAARRLRCVRGTRTGLRRLRGASRRGAEGCSRRSPCGSKAADAPVRTTERGAVGVVRGRAVLLHWRRLYVPGFRSSWRAVLIFSARAVDRGLWLRDAGWFAGPAE